MKNQPVSPLRQRMIEDMTIRNLAPTTQKIHLSAVEKFSSYFHSSPDKLSFKDVRTYQLHLISRGLQPTTINAIMAGLRFFYKITMGFAEASTYIPLMRRSYKLPVVLTTDEVTKFLKAAPSLKYYALFTTIYATGLRVSEAAKLKVGDIDSKRMVIHIRNGKGRKDRLVQLSRQLLDLLRLYWKSEHPQEWLFPSRRSKKRLTVRSLQRTCRKMAVAAGITDKHVTVHTLRHCFATHLLEDGVDIRVIQHLLGHYHINSTAHYVHVATNIIHETPSLLGRLHLNKAPEQTA